MIGLCWSRLVTVWPQNLQDPKKFTIKVLKMSKIISIVLTTRESINLNMFFQVIKVILMKVETTATRLKIMINFLRDIITNLTVLSPNLIGIVINFSKSKFSKTTQQILKVKKDSHRARFILSEKYPSYISSSSCF